MKFRSICYPSAAARDGRGPLGLYFLEPSRFELESAEVRRVPLDLAARLQNLRRSAELMRESLAASEAAELEEIARILERDARPSTTCPHGEPLEDCDACYRAGDEAADAWREGRSFR